MAKSRKQSGSFDAGHANMQVLQALQKKYNRDYLPYFKGLSDLYISGSTKKKLNATVRKVEKIQTLLSSILENGRIQVKDSEELYTLVDAIEEDKRYFAEEAEKVKAFQERINKVSAETGIEPEDLNVSKEIVREGVRHAHRTERSSRPSFKQEYGATYRSGASLVQGLGAAMLGPMYPVAKMAAGVAGDVGKFFRKRGEAVEQRLGTSLSTSLRSRSGFDQVTQARERPPGLGEFRRDVRGGSTMRSRTAPLREFFDREAYKAKWTKELLSSAKEGKRKRLDFFNRLKGRMTALGAGILPLIGKAGALAGIGLAAYLTATKLRGVANKFSEFADVHKKVSVEVQKQVELQKRFRNQLNTTLGMNLRKSLKAGSEADRVGVIQQIKQVEKERAQRQTAGTGLWSDWKAGARSIFGGKKRPAITPPAPLEVPPSAVAAPTAVRPAAANIEAAKTTTDVNLDKLNDNLRALTEQLQKNQPVSGTSGVGSRFDSGDVLLNEHANGTLSLGE